MADEQDPDQKTEAPTARRRGGAMGNGELLQARGVGRALGPALVILVGAAWIALAGPMLMSSLQTMLSGGLSFGHADVSDFDPGQAILRLLGAVALPVLIL